MALACPATSGTPAVASFPADQGFSGDLNGLDLLSPEGVIPWGGLFLPDPSIGRWALWRQPVGDSAFFLIRSDSHTLSTPAALAHLQDLVSEPVQRDALICSSTAGRSVVETVLRSRGKPWQHGLVVMFPVFKPPGLNFR